MALSHFRIASQDAYRALATDFVRYIAPVAWVTFGFEGVTVAIESLKGKAGPALALASILLICFPAQMVLDAVISSMYLNACQSGTSPAIRPAWVRSVRSGAIRLCVRLSLRYLLWFVATILVYAVLDGILKRHFGLHGSSATWEARGGVPLLFHKTSLIVCLAVFAGVLSRYAFAEPLFAFEERPQLEVMKRAMALSRKRRGILWWVAAAVCALLLAVNDLAKAGIDYAGYGHRVHVSWTLLDLCFTSVITTWYLLFKVALMLPLLREASAALPS